MAATIRGPPHADPRRVDFGAALRVRDGVLEVRDLHGGDDLVARLARGGVAGAEAAVVVDEDAHVELRLELRGDVVEVHFFDGGKAVVHDEAGQLVAGGA